jgi:putative MFS transporter
MFCFRIIFGMIYAYTNEVYSTDIRALGMGYASGFSRFCLFIMPYIIFPLYEMSTFLPFLLFSLLCLKLMIVSYNLKYDTTDKNLDFLNEKRESELSIFEAGSHTFL